jgi:RNA polymerase sigma-70 factor (ECF subfamily)
MEEDIRLYKEFINGDNKSFEELIYKHKDALIYFIQRYVKTIDIAEDIAQDVFVYVLMNKKEYDFKYALKTYLYTIGRSRALNYLKTERKTIEINANFLISEDVGLEEKIFIKEREDNLKKAIKKISPRYQTAIYLADIEELKYKEISKILNKSIPQTKMLIYRARKALSRVIQKEAIKYEG